MARVSEMLHQGRLRSVLLQLVPLLLIACLPPPPPESGAAASHDGELDSSEGRAPDAAAGTATLHGPVGLIDGEPAPNTGQPVEISAGCHVIVTRANQIMHSDVNVVIRMQVRAVEVHVAVRPGHRYFIEQAVADPSAPASTVRTTVREEDSTGRTSTVFLAVAPTAERNACRPLTASSATE